jgi:hypothetical protein
MLQRWNDTKIHSFSNVETKKDVAVQRLYDILIMFVEKSQTLPNSLYSRFGEWSALMIPNIAF